MVVQTQTQREREREIERVTVVNGWRTICELVLLERKSFLRILLLLLLLLLLFLHNGLLLSNNLILSLILSFRRI